MLSRREFLARSMVTAGGTLLSSDAVFAAMARDPAGSIPVSAGPMLYLNNDLIPVAQIVNVQQMSNAAPASNTSTVRSALVPQLRTTSTAIAGQVQLQMNWLDSKALADWISAAAAHAPTASSGTLLVIGDDLQVHSSYAWNGGTITQILLPACDATVQVAAYPTLSFQASAMSSSLSATPSPTANRRLALQRWQSDHFKVTSNVELQLVRTMQVSAISLNPAARGGSADIVLSYESAQGAAMQPWANAVNNPGGQPVPGESTEITITYLGVDFRTPVCSVTLHDCRVLRMSTQAVNTRASHLTATVGFADATLGLMAVLTGSPDDAALLRAIARADRASFETLYGRYARRIHQYARTFVRDHSLAEEIVIDTLLAVWQGADRFDGNSRASTWILGIARHKALDAVRRRRSADEGDDLESVPELTSEAPGPEEHTSQMASAMQLRAALSRLAPSHREVLWLAFFEDLPYQDIGRLLDVPLNTVKTRVFHAKQKLRLLLDSPAAVMREA